MTYQKNCKGNYEHGCNFNAEALKNNPSTALQNFVKFAKARRARNGYFEFCFKEKIRQTPNSLNGRGAESANGGSILERGEVTVDMMVDGHACQMTFKDMDVSMPITSGRACVGGGDTFAIIHQNGGSLKNITTGKEIKLYARQGVHFFRAAILAPDSLAPDMTSPFARQG